MKVKMLRNKKISKVTDDKRTAKVAKIGDIVDLTKEDAVYFIASKWATDELKADKK